MVFRGKIPPEKRALAIYLRQESGLSYRKIAEKCNISTSSAERICNENLFQDNTWATQGNAVDQEKFHTV